MDCQQQAGNEILQHIMMPYQPDQKTSLGSPLSAVLFSISSPSPLPHHKPPSRKSSSRRQRWPEPSTFALEVDATCLHNSIEIILPILERTKSVDLFTGGDSIAQSRLRKTLGQQQGVLTPGKEAGGIGPSEVSLEHTLLPNPVGWDQGYYSL